MPNLTQEALTQQIYENKCAHPSLEDILNCFYELPCSELVSLFHDLASVIHQAWHAENIELSASLRERFRRTVERRRPTHGEFKRMPLDAPVTSTIMEATASLRSPVLDRQFRRRMPF